MSDIKSVSSKVPALQKTLFGYEISKRNAILLNYLIPAFVSCLLYIFLIACDIALVYRHYKDDNPIWGSLSLLIMYVPALGSYCVIISSLELWPDIQGLGFDNFTWTFLKTIEHLFFPVWSMWRFAERIFWSVEGFRTEDDKERQGIIKQLTAPRSIELYVFLQAYLHSLPQVLFQMNLLMRQPEKTNPETVGVESASIILNLIKVASTTAYFQRFKTQKLAGKQYPWFKYEKLIQKSPALPELDSNARSSSSNQGDIVLRSHSPTSTTATTTVTPGKSRLKIRRSSSDLYLQPTNSLNESSEERVQAQQRPSSRTESDQGDRSSQQDTAFQRRVTRPISSLAEDSREFFNKKIVDPIKKLSTIKYLRETSVLDIPKRAAFRDVNFDIKRVKQIKGLPEDDIAGKLMSFLWWFNFLLARVLAVSTFYYFYPRVCFYLLLSHTIIIILILLYNVKTGDLKKSKIIFFGFLGLIYLFCIIEFKIKFKNAKLIYRWFFIFVYGENLLMCLIWWFNDMDELQSEFWFRFIFIVILMSSLFSVITMFIYLFALKPEKIVVATKPLDK